LSVGGDTPPNIIVKKTEYQLPDEKQGILEVWDSQGTARERVVEN
jgi:hypothetical protein